MFTSGGLRKSRYPPPYRSPSGTRTRFTRVKVSRPTYKRWGLAPACTPHAGYKSTSQFVITRTTKGEWCSPCYHGFMGAGNLDRAINSGCIRGGPGRFCPGVRVSAASGFPTRRNYSQALSVSLPFIGLIRTRLGYPCFGATPFPRPSCRRIRPRALTLLVAIQVRSCTGQGT